MFLPPKHANPKTSRTRTLDRSLKPSSSESPKLSSSQAVNLSIYQAPRPQTPKLPSAHTLEHSITQALKHPSTQALKLPSPHQAFKHEPGKFLSPQQLKLWSSGDLNSGDMKPLEHVVSAKNTSKIFRCNQHIKQAGGDQATVADVPSDKPFILVVHPACIIQAPYGAGTWYCFILLLLSLSLLLFALVPPCVTKEALSYHHPFRF